MLESVEQLGHFYEFDSFRLDVMRRLLWRNGAQVPLTPKAFDLMLALVQHHGDRTRQGRTHEVAVAQSRG
jgi:DNA-binding response OmpR family regulator